MAVKIRLKRMGKVRTPFYRIVVADSRTRRDGRVIEEIGTYNPKADPSIIHVDSDRAQHWLGVGAQPSEPVAALLRVTGDWQKFKGEPAPAPMKVAEPRRDKTDIFNDALKDAHGDRSSEAVTKKAARPAKKAAAAPDTAAPDTAAPDTAAPETAAPDTAAPDTAAQAETEAAAEEAVDAPIDTPTPTETNADTAADELAPAPADEPLPTPADETPEGAADKAEAEVDETLSSEATHKGEG